VRLHRVLAPEGAPPGSRPRRLKGLSLNRMIPNILTLLALCAGMTAILFSLHGRWQAAVVAVVVAAILDALDGRIARLLKGASRFGAELDSLSDFICFGVAPAMVLYLWAMQDAGRFAFGLSLLFSACCALRLARFNTNLDEPVAPPWAANFFTGVPAPAGAGLALLPMILSFQLGDDVFRRPEVVGLVMLLVAGLMVSRIPTYAAKKLKVAHRWVLPTMVLVVVLAASVVSAPWLTMSAAGVLYLASIPFSVRSYRLLEKKSEEPGAVEVGTDDEDDEDDEEGGEKEPKESSALRREP
jgi:CDP-diacylglycerol--serine O-phosphatidyltransferase